MGNFPSVSSLAVRNHVFDAGSVQNSLSQARTNGKSKWGTLMAATLPAYLTDNPLPNGRPWSTLSSTTNYYQDYPLTGVIRSYDFTISSGHIAPDGYERSVLLVNGAFPGPLIEANWGDTIQVTVHNNISTPEEGMALHWHGFIMKDTPWEDGTPGVTQCPIPPGKSFTYQFQATLYGSTWYHSHYSAQYAGGLIGPMVIHGPTTKKYDVDVGPILLSDWYHEDYFTLVEKTMAVNSTGVIADSNLINGKNNFDCSTLPPDDKTPCISTAGISRFRFQSGKTHLLRLINAGSAGTQSFSIDGHKLTVIANDFVPVEPYETTSVTLGVGQRTDVLVTADGDLPAYYMRSSIPSSCRRNRNPHAQAAILYDDVAESTIPTSTPWDMPSSCLNDDLSLTRPFVKLALPEPDVTYNMEAVRYTNETGHNLWKFDGVAFRGNYNSPTLLLADLGNATFEEQWNVRDTGSAKSVRVNVWNNSPAVHPMHLHGFNMYILHEGDGQWDGTTIIHPENPQRRDVFQVRGNGHLVMQFDAAENPGMWPFHCHIAWHVSQGFFVQFLTMPDEVEKMRIPNVVAETCRQWGEWTETNIPPQIDSGL